MNHLDYHFIKMLHVSNFEDDIVSPHGTSGEVDDSLLSSFLFFFAAFPRKVWCDFRLFSPFSFHSFVFIIVVI